MQNDELLANFSNPEVIARYTQGPPRYMPGYADMQRMTGVLLAEKIPEDARVLVLGAGGGLELKAFADTYPGWIFDGVDPAPDMLTLARQTLGPLSSAYAYMKVISTMRRKARSMRRRAFSLCIFWRRRNGGARWKKSAAV